MDAGWQRLEEAVNEADRAAKKRRRAMRRGPEEAARWEDAVHRFHAALESLCIASGLRDLQAGNAEAARLAIDFLASDVRCFGSGYLREHICRVLRGVRLHEREKQRLRELLLRWPAGRHAREFTYLAKLAPQVADSHLVEELQQRAGSADARTRWRARRVLQVLQSRGWSVRMGAQATGAKADS